MRRAALFAACTIAALGSAFGQIAWTATGQMNAPHTQHPATLLPNGKVLVVGTLSCNPGCYSGSTAELYDPVSGAWTVTSQPNTSRFNHIAELLPNGKVLVAGGYLSPSVLTGSAELYDPTTGTWSPTGSLATPRQFHQSALLPGGKVLVVGGLGMGGQGTFLTLSSAEIYDPATGLWSPAGNMSVPRWTQSTTTLSDGRVLVVGGTSGSGSTEPPLQSAELYDPLSGTWTLTTAPGTAREEHRSALLPSGQVLVTGGSGPAGCIASTELYDPVADRWNPAASMSGARLTHSLTVLPSGAILVAGGDDCTGAVNSAEIYDQVNGTWSPAPSLTQARSQQSATLLQNGKVLVAGGGNGTSGVEKGFNSSEVFGVNVVPAGEIVSVSAANYFDNAALAPESLASAFGSNLASTTQTAQGSPLPFTLAGVTVSVQDSAGTARQAPLLAVSPGQINYEVPSGSAAGTAMVTVNQGGVTLASGNVLIASVAPGVFAADNSGHGIAAALVQRVEADDTQSYEPVAQFNAAQNQFLPVPIDLGPPSEQVFLVLFGTGIRSRSAASAAVATIGSATVAGAYAGPVAQFTGLDQVNLLLPRTLAGSGQIEVTLSVDGLTANTVLISIQ